MTPLASTAPLLKMFYSALVAGVGIAVVFSVAILGAIRSGDMRRAGRAAAASAYAALAASGFLLSAAMIVYGLILVARKR